MLTSFDALSREQSQKIRATFAACRRSQAKPADPNNDKSSNRSGPVTIDEFLSAANEAADPSDRDYFLLKAVHQAAEKKDFNRAISILDAVGAEQQQRLKSSWDSLRWDYASESACVYLTGNDRSAMLKVIDATPERLKAFVNISLAINCKAATEKSQILEFMEAGRTQLQKADKSEQPVSYLSLVRLYAKHSPADAPAVLGNAIAAINRVPEDKNVDCGSDQPVSVVLSTQMILNWYGLPASIIETDDIGVRNAVAGIQSADKRAATRLQLLRGALEQNQITEQKAANQRTK